MMPLVGADYYMNMIRHYTPRQQVITFTIEMMQRIGNDFGNFIILEPAVSVSSV